MDNISILRKGDQNLLVCLRRTRPNKQKIYSFDCENRVIDIVLERSMRYMRLRNKI